MKPTQPTMETQQVTSTSRNRISLHCGSCYQLSSVVGEAYRYTCTTCGAPSFACTTCATQAGPAAADKHAPVITTCVRCSVEEEVADPGNGVVENQNQRRCIECGGLYTPDEAEDTGFWDPPYCYDEGCHDTCLDCWLIVGPVDLSRISRT